MIFSSYPFHKKRMKEASDELEKRDIKWDIVFLFGRIVSMITALIFLMWLLFKELS